MCVLCLAHLPVQPLIKAPFRDSVSGPHQLDVAEFFFLQKIIDCTAAASQDFLKLLHGIAAFFLRIRSLSITVVVDHHRKSILCSVHSPFSSSF
jgi:hypothetical protein